MQVFWFQLDGVAVLWHLDEMPATFSIEADNQANAAIEAGLFSKASDTDKHALLDVNVGLRRHCNRTGPCNRRGALCSHWVDRITTHLVRGCQNSIGVAHARW